jgi:hypothetical protein
MEYHIDETVNPPKAYIFAPQLTDKYYIKEARSFIINKYEIEPKNILIIITNAINSN